jgi:flagellar biogenesis protein FliO
MKPRIGAISFRLCGIIVVGACVVSGTGVAWAAGDGEIGSSPGPRPQAIPPVVAEPDVAPSADVAPEGLDEALATEEVAGEVPIGSQEPAASVAERTLVLPMPAAHESQLIAGDAPAQAGSLGWLDPRTNEVVRVAGALALVIGLILLLRAAARRLGGPLLDGGRPSGVLLVLARYPIARGQTLVLLKLGRRLLLCHQAKGAMAMLCEIEGEDEVAAMLARIEAGSRGRDAARFEKMLEDFNQEHRRRAVTSRGDTPDMRRAIAQAQVVDLTRRPGSGNGSGGPGNWLRLRRAAS